MYKDGHFIDCCRECLKYKFPKDPTMGLGTRYSELLAAILCEECFQIIEIHERENTIEKLTRMNRCYPKEG